MKYERRQWRKNNNHAVSGFDLFKMFIYFSSVFVILRILTKVIQIVFHRSSLKSDETSKVKP